ncbi:4Fe-4S dicluster domain-containing protein [Telmatospirillum siberiense]|uniref:Propanediol utilization protein n=1 Tax=Telmatospirillum siberiense TaxID=382514 RepID=A0A2N3PUL0_9PROT|nr:4Fe-4S dicluster domain-containing protein [Telmatospirillum siberiense]PKU24092.1 propanediol utilization protein [Telmatospirillum siberiense]
MDKQAFLAAVKAAGIVGEGGAGFPAHVKYAAEAETVIANGCECEPLLHTDQHHMLHHAERIVRALDWLKEAAGAKRGVIALKRKYVEATGILTAAIGSRPLEVALLDNFYPAGDEQVLVREVTGRSVPPLGLPLQVGAVVANVGTLVSVSHAMDGQPLMDKILTVTGEVGNPGIVRAPIGTPLAACLAAAGGARIADPIYVIGGPMMGRVVDDAAAFEREVVTKTSGGLIVLPRGHYLHVNATQSSDHLRIRAAAACIQCRMCSDLCPRQLLGHPFDTHRVMRAFGTGAELSSETGKLALMCCDCGVCEHYSCPMGLSPRRINQAVKTALRAKKISYDGSREIDEARTDWRTYRRVPVPRLASRIGIASYVDLAMADLGEITPSEVRIPLRQHIGAPAKPVVGPGETVHRGDLLGEIPPDALGARVHATIDGTVRSVGEAVIIAR